MFSWREIESLAHMIRKTPVIAARLNTEKPAHEPKIGNRRFEIRKFRDR